MWGLHQNCHILTFIKHCGGTIFQLTCHLTKIEWLVNLCGVHMESVILNSVKQHWGNHFSTNIWFH